MRRTLWSIVTVMISLFSSVSLAVTIQGGSTYAPPSTTTMDYTHVGTGTMGGVNNATNAAAQQGQGSNMAQIAGLIMAGVAAYTCSTCASTGSNCSTCTASTIGALASMLTGQQMDAAQQMAYDQAYDLGADAGTTGDDTAPGSTRSNDKAYQNILKKASAAAKQAGMEVTKDGKLKTADGRVIDPASAVTSGAGLNSGESLKLGETLKKAMDEAKKQAGKGLPEGGEGGGDEGGGRGRSVVASGGLDTVSGRNLMAKAGAGRTPSSVAGAFKEFNGDRIGVAGDSVFEMMSRRYKNHNERDSFIKAP